MDANEFRVKAKEMVDYIADYIENVKEKRVTPDIEPGYLTSMLPKHAPIQGEDWNSIMNDFDNKIMPGLTHWQHPRFHAYFPAGNSYPSILGEFLSAGLGTVGFSWAASPACTELETVVVHWLGKMIDIPKAFLPFLESEQHELLDKIRHSVPYTTVEETENEQTNGNEEIDHPCEIIKEISNEIVNKVVENSKEVITGNNKKSIDQNKNKKNDDTNDEENDKVESLTDFGSKIRSQGKVSRRTSVIPNLFEELDDKVIEEAERKMSKEGNRFVDKRASVIDVLKEAKNEVIGGGVILGSASESILVSMLSARTEALQRLKDKHPLVEDGVLLSRLVMYASKYSHSSVEKGAMIALVKIRLLDTDENYSMRGDVIKKQIEDDRSLGLIPFLVSCTFGTTSVCSFDNIREIGEICRYEDIYCHVDGAYAGSALICPEFRPYIDGLELADSFNFNPNKWMLMNFDCSCLWVKDKYMLTKALSVNPIYLRYKEQDHAIDYRHWGIALSRRFRALKIWFTIRSYGIVGLQKYIREHCRLAKYFEKLMKTDERFEIMGKVDLGLVCFRIKGPNQISQNLLFKLNDEGQIHMIPSMLEDKYMIRFCVNAENANDDDMIKAWEIIKEAADVIAVDFPYKEIFQLKNRQINEPNVESKKNEEDFGIKQMNESTKKVNDSNSIKEKLDKKQKSKNKKQSSCMDKFFKKSK